MTPDELSAAIEKAITAAERSLQRAMSANEREAMAGILDQIARLKIKGSRIIPNTANLKIKASIRRNLDKLIFGADFQAGVNAVIAGIEKIAELLDIYFTEFAGFAQGPQLKALIESASQQVAITLSGQGWGASVTNAVDEMFQTSITSASTPRELIMQIRDFIERGGLETFNRVNVKQIATDAMGQFMRTYMKQASDRLKLDWYRYAGGLVKDTRDFCRARDGKYFHRSEIEKWPELTWDGKVKGTNSATIYSYLGGWNCLHHLTPVKAARVPATDRARIA